MFGHIAHGTSREETKEFGELLEMGEAALAVIGIDVDAERIGQEAELARAHVLKRNVADWAEADQEAPVAIEREHARV